MLQRPKIPLLAGVCQSGNTTYLDQPIPVKPAEAAEGSGLAAKSSNESMRLAARLLLGEAPNTVFKAVMK